LSLVSSDFACNCSSYSFLFFGAVSIQNK